VVIIERWIQTLKNNWKPWTKRRK